jgi:phosphoglycerate dehydrogenase-like enzyme
VIAHRRTDAPSPLDGVEMVGSMAELAARADHLVLAAPGTARTRHVIDAASIAQMKAGVHLVNIARGSLVDQDALRVGLDDGPIARASLDVTDPEPLKAGHWLFEHPKVFLTPHSSWAGPPFLSVATDIFCQNLARYLDGQPLLYEVSTEGY